mgnify:CR=1
MLVLVERKEGLIFVHGPLGFFGVVDTEDKLRDLLARHGFIEDDDK